MRKIGVKYCASCRNGENLIPADVEVKGRTFRYAECGTPYRAYLCDGHLSMMLEDGDDLHIVRRLPPFERVK